MVLRTAHKGSRQGQQFWGCSKFPKCRGSISGPESESPNDSSQVAEPNGRNMKGGHESIATPHAPHGAPDGTTAPGQAVGLRGKLAAAASKVVETVDKIERRSLESGEPDAAGRWDPDHRRKVLRYVYERDGGRCGLCAGEMKLKAAHVDHIVPKVFAVFDVRKGGRAEPGTPLQEPPPQARQPAGRSHLLQQAQGQQPQRPRLAAPGNAALAGSRRHRRHRVCVALEAEGTRPSAWPASGMNIAMACVCGATATARAKRDTWRFGHAHRWCGADELTARRRRKERA